jgi:hypothetical protein
MSTDRITMSQRERDRLKVMAPVLSGKRTQVEAARLLDRSTRQVRRIQRRMESEGDIGVMHRLRGRTSNARKDKILRRQVLRAYVQDYSGFGPTLAAEKLTVRGLPVSAETLRQWLISMKLWEPRQRRHRHRRRRDRRECFGELVQTDGSIHDWLEGRGPRMTLLVLIDDATSKVVARFYPAETTDGYFRLLKRYLRKHGRMLAIYADRNSIFFATDKHGELVVTQFGRALKQLGIDLIPASSPQAKGRVERFNGTAQDRLVKELRLAEAETMAQANEVVDKVFLPWFNRRCTVKPASDNDAHRPLGRSLDLKAILSTQDKRKVANDYTIRFNNTVYQLLPPAVPGLCGGRVVLEQRLDGSLRVRFGKKYLKYEVLNHPNSLGALPPNPRSLTPLRIPAQGEQSKSRTAETMRPCAVHPIAGRSGRTPAEPYPSDDNNESTAKEPRRPAPEHPWRKSFIKLQTPKPDIPILAK